jgi:hypothetical protein
MVAAPIKIDKILTWKDMNALLLASRLSAANRKSLPQVHLQQRASRPADWFYSTPAPFVPLVG